jgi:glycosyltransferase involved in cell wall biosynthesis
MDSLSKKKVMYVITKSNWGGAQRYVYDLASNLSKNDFEVSVAFGQPGLLAQKLKADGIPTHTITALTRDVSFWADIQSFFELLSLFRKEKPNVAHLNSSKAAGLGALAARLASVPRIIFTAHGWPFWEQRNVFARALIYFFSWLTALLSHQVIVVSNYDLRIARLMPGVGHKTIRIYNGINLPMSFGSGDNIRRQFPSHARITGTIGELTRNKNQEALIDQAAAEQDMFVAIIGEGEDRPHLEWEIQAHGLEHRVKLFGFMPAVEVLRGFDTFALPSIKEGLPYVLIEAKAAGLPIVANPVGGVSEIVQAKDLAEFSLQRMLQNTEALYR